MLICFWRYHVNIAVKANSSFLCPSDLTELVIQVTTPKWTFFSTQTWSLFPRMCFIQGLQVGTPHEFCKVLFCIVFTVDYLQVCVCAFDSKGMVCFSCRTTLQLVNILLESGGKNQCKNIFNVLSQNLLFFLICEKQESGIRVSEMLHCSVSHILKWVTESKSSKL